MSNIFLTFLFLYACTSARPHSNKDGQFVWYEDFNERTSNFRYAYQAEDQKDHHQGGESNLAAENTNSTLLNDLYTIFTSTTISPSLERDDFSPPQAKEEEKINKNRTSQQDINNNPSQIPIIFEQHMNGTAPDFSDRIGTAVVITLQGG